MQIFLYLNKIKLDSQKKKRTRAKNILSKTDHGAFRESNSGPLAPKARIIPLDQMPALILKVK